MEYFTVPNVLEQLKVQVIKLSKVQGHILLSEGTSTHQFLIISNNNL